MPGGKKKYRPPSQVKTDAKILNRVLANQIWQQIERIIASLVAQMVKSLPAVQKTQVQSLDREDPLEKGMATHSSILAWRIPWTEKPDRPQSLGSQRVRQD